ncbi:winged helix-turn-helix domain-containing protein [Shewanella seohaensis]|uniref:winged helix-turn-helix domain-containing protein n=1 Tax=Shewanella seohaensis TaxID=755175 RepID=UPI0021C9655A|nr:winged helix-turn-helix domain-containing protein [Shewanella seohaensis]UXM81862.1 winged helix-turn-helix domain-containing protein [Shewanella seohaensis]
MKLGDYRVGTWWIVARELKLIRYDEQHQLIEESLPPKVFEVLLKLVTSADHTVTRNELIEDVWAGNVSVGTRGITNAIYALRKLLDEGDERSINTISKTGYQLLLPVSRPTESFKPDTLPSSKRSRVNFRTMMLVAATLAVLFLLMVSYFVTREPAASVIRYSKPEPISYLEGIEETPSVSPDGKSLAFMWMKDNEPARIFVQSLTEANATLRQLSFSEFNETTPTWSPDGKQIAYLRLDDSGACEVWIKELKTVQERKLTSCVQERYHKALDWSPSGKFLALIDATASGNTAVFLYELSSGKKTQVSFPKQGERDHQLAWAHASDTLAFIRALGTFTYDLYLLPFGEQVQRLTHDEVPIHGLTWDIDDKGIVFNSVRDGGHAYWRYLVASADIEFVHRDQTPFNIVALPQSKSYAYVKHASQEQLVYIHDAKEQVIESTGRDLYGVISPDRQQLAFLSNRSGKFEIWVSDTFGRQAFQLTNSQGLPDLASWSPDGHSILTVVDSANEKPKVIQTAVSSREQKPYCRMVFNIEILCGRIPQTP